MFTNVARLSLVMACLSASACAPGALLSPTVPTIPPVESSAGATVVGTVAYTVSGTGAASPTRATDLMVSVKGTGIMATVGGDGGFALSGVPAGMVTLRFASSSVDAYGMLSGVSPGTQITVTVVISGGVAEIAVRSVDWKGRSAASGLS